VRCAPIKVESGPEFLRAGWGISLSPAESNEMFVYRVRLPGQMFAQVVRRAPQMFAWAVAILRDKYREIGHLIGMCNREIDPIRAKVHV
jgi:hypothetical protein